MKKLDIPVSPPVRGLALLVTPEAGEAVDVALHAAGLLAEAKRA